MNYFKIVLFYDLQQYFFFTFLSLGQKQSTCVMCWNVFRASFSLLLFNRVSHALVMTQMLHLFSLQGNLNFETATSFDQGSTETTIQFKHRNWKSVFVFSVMVHSATAIEMMQRVWNKHCSNVLSAMIQSVIYVREELNKKTDLWKKWILVFIKKILVLVLFFNLFHITGL